MNKKRPTGQTDAADLNSAVRALHDELKSLILTCAPNFPKVARGGLKFVSDIVDVQGEVASYSKQVLVRLFRSDSAAGNLILTRASGFIRPWEERRTLPKKETRSEAAIDAKVRRQLKLLRREMLTLGEEELRALNADENIPEVLYYSSIVVQGLCWYADRYLARLTGELARMEQ